MSAENVKGFTDRGSHAASSRPFRRGVGAWHRRRARAAGLVHSGPPVDKFFNDCSGFGVVSCRSGREDSNSCSTGEPGMEVTAMLIVAPEIDKLTAAVTAVQGLDAAGLAASSLNNLEALLEIRHRLDAVTAHVLAAVDETSATVE